MNLEIWLTYLLAAIVLSVTPGAGAVNTMSNGIHYGLRYTLISIAGLQCALVLQIALVGAGLGAIVASSETLFNLIKWLGVGYLIYLGISKWRERGTLQMAGPAARRVPLRGLFSRAVLVNLSNPKSIVFLVALFPQFLDPALPQLPQLLVLGVTTVCVDMAVMIGYASLASRLAGLICNERRMRLQNRLFGGAFVGAGVLLASAGR